MPACHLIFVALQAPDIPGLRQGDKMPNLKLRLRPRRALGRRVNKGGW